MTVFDMENEQGDTSFDASTFPAHLFIKQPEPEPIVYKERRRKRRWTKLLMWTGLSLLVSRG
jgi:hypothetical protein